MSSQFPSGQISTPPSPDAHAPNGRPKPFKLATLIPILGSWEIDAGRAAFTRYENKLFKVGVAIGEIRATSGRIRATIEFDDSDKAAEGRILFGFDAATGRGFSAGVGGYDRAFVLDEIAPVLGNAKLIHGLGKRESLKRGGSYALEVILRGTNVQLHIDGVKVLEQNLPHALLGDQIGILAYGNGGVTFVDVEVVPIRPRAFVVMQFTEPYNSLWEEVIKPVAEKIGLEAYRADDVFRPGIVLQDIVRGISTSQVIIAEVTPKNPNVYYELGYAHAVGVPTILLAEQPAENSPPLPFDISGFRCIFYDDAIRGKRKVEAALEKHLRNILERSDEPVGANGNP